jgi:hypothetical protein
VDVVNRTAFPALAFEGLDTEDQPFHVLVMRITYVLRPGAGAAPLAGHCTHHLDFADDQAPLAATDSFLGDPAWTSPRGESDYAPFKPRCDVLVLGRAHAPHCRPRRRFTASMKLLRPGPAGQVLLDASLAIVGPRWFRKKRWPLRWIYGLLRFGSLGLVRVNPWTLTAPAAVGSVPLTYEYAFGGTLTIPVEAMPKVPKKHRLPPARQQDLGQPCAAYARNEANPIGMGHAALWALKAGRVKRLPAPQIEDPGRPVTSAYFWRNARGRIKPGKELTPAGCGPLGRGWSPRRLLAGTPDAVWVRERHPLLPRDFDFGYWNCAHPEWQTEHLRGNEVLTLANLLPADEPSAFQDAQGNTLARFALPGHEPFVLVRYPDGRKASVPLMTDTLILDLESASVTQVVRARLPRSEPIQGLEFRMEVNPSALPAAREAGRP